MTKNIDIGGRLHSTATGNIVTGANEVYDDNKGKKQSEINAETHNYVEKINNALENLNPEQQEALTIAEKTNNNEAKLGYCVCDTEGNLAEKVISDATNYLLSKGGSIKVKMTNANTANNVTLNINSTGAKSLYYAGERASSSNSWEAGETVEVYYDGTNFYANNVVGGSNDVFNISAKTGQNYETLDAALTAANSVIPVSKKKGGMSIKFIQFTPASYSVVRTDGLTEQPIGSELNIFSSVVSGTYNAGQLNDFITLPATTGAASAITYYVVVRQVVEESHITTYTSWVITKATNDIQEYVQYRLISTEWNTTVADWQGVDDEPVAGSKNLVESGGVKKELALGAVYDVSAHNNGATFVSLSALLSDINLNTLIPLWVRKGGMSIKFVQTSDNKYVQYRLMADVWSDNTNDWSFCGDSVYVENPEWIYVLLDAEKKILAGIKSDGNIEWSIGVPTPVKTYIANEIAKIKNGTEGTDIDGLNKIIAFLSEFSTSDTLKDLLNTKVDKENGKSLVNAEYADGVSQTENPEFVEAHIDAEDKILYGVKKNGDFYFGAGVPSQIQEELDNIDEVTANKVDKEEDKGLVDNQYVEEAEYDELIKVTCDAEGKVLQGIKKDGSPYFPHHEMMGVGSISGYNHVVLDEEDKIVEGIDEEGKHVFNAGIEIGQLKTESGIESGGWIDVKTDSEGRILEGINKDGEKHISKFDKSTQDLIKGFASGSSDYISIPILDANFTPPVPVEITGTKGSDNAKYVFDLPLSDDAFNIRFKFRITENILNQQKSCVIASLGNYTAVHAQVTKLYQVVRANNNDNTKVSYWPALQGGVSLNGSNIGRPIVSGNLNIGLFAFSVKYVGQSHDVTIENDGESIILSIDGNTTVFSFSSYQNISELYEALSNDTNLEVSYRELESHSCQDLAVFSPIKLVSQYWSGVNGGASDTIEEYWDTAPLFIPYAVDNTWHQVEIVKIGNSIYSACDGVIVVMSGSDNLLTLGGGCGVLFKDLEIHTKSVYDAEYISDKNFIISSANPHIVIHEGHGIDKVPHYKGYVTDNMATTIDRLQLIYSAYKAKGYVPVSINDIAEYYAGNKNLPKRCYVTIYDDYRYENCLDLENRSVHTKFGVKPALAIISGNNTNIVHNSNVISKQQATDICRMNNFALVSHTRNHRYCTNIKPSSYISEFTEDVYTSDLVGVDNSIIVYPYGATNIYMYDVLEWLGFRLGINIQGNNPNIKNRNKFALWREEIGFRISIDAIMSKIV